MDARRQPAIQNAPQVLYTNREPPLELRGVSGLKDSDYIGYVTFGKGSNLMQYYSLATFKVKQPLIVSLVSKFSETIFTIISRHLKHIFILECGLV